MGTEWLPILPLDMVTLLIEEEERAEEEAEGRREWQGKKTI